MSLETNAADSGSHASGMLLRVVSLACTMHVGCVKKRQLGSPLQQSRTTNHATRASCGVVVGFHNKFQTWKA